MSLGIDRATESDPEPKRTIGGTTRFSPGQNHDQITVVNGKVQLGQRLGDLWRNRDLLLLLTRTELKIKYKSSVLGYLWSMLNPALVLGIYYCVFTIISKNGQPNFAIWLMAGLLVWNLFNGSAMAATSVVVGKAGIVKKVAFPRELLALSVVGVAMVMFVLQACVLVISMLIFQISPDWKFLLLLPEALVALIIFTSAVSIFLSAVNVYLRDTQHLTEVALMAWFWGTPIVYSFEMIAHKVATHPHLVFIKYLYLADPITPIAMTFQRAIYGKTAYVSNSPGNTTHALTQVLPDWSMGGYAALLGVVIVVSLLLFLGALIVFGRLEGNFAEEL